MTTKLIILIVVGLLVFGALVYVIVKAWRYRRNHPDEVYWPYNGPLHKKRKSKPGITTTLVATLTLSTLMWTNGLMAQSGTPDGTREHPYPIGDISTLISFAQCINNNQPFAFEDGKFVFDIDGNIPAGGADTYFEQTADIDMNSANWNIPIGMQNKGFEGTYLGGGHKIKHLTLTAANPALFCHSKGHISDLTIENPVFNGTFNDGGALATYVMGGTIDNCHVTGNDLVFNGKDCGALIGWVGQLSDYFKADSITISNCSNRCHITSTYQQSNANDQNSVAGVVAVINARHYVVTRCFNTGDITSTYRPKFQNDELCFAGVVGRGLLPNYPSEITYCYNRGDITAHCGYLGGVAGFFNDEAGISNSTRCAIDYCFNTGNITGECVLNSDNPSEHADADSSLNVFSLGGVVAPCKTPTRYCFNTGNVTLTKHPHPKFNIWGDQGVAGVGSNAEHCFNVGEIYNYEERNGRAAGVARDTADSCLNAACVYDRNPKYTFSPHNIARIIIGDCFSDAQMSVDGQDGNLYPTSKIIGESFSGQLGEDWIYEKGRYPRLKWTDTCDWARDIAKVACTPIILADNVTDIHHVKNGIRLTGCDSGVVWIAPEGNCLFDDPTLANTACSNNAIQPALALQPLCGDFVTVAATLNGDTIKTVTLLRSVAMPHDTLTVDNLDDLKTLRDGVNTGKAFPYKSYELPRYADGVTFKLTTDLDMQSESPWVPIGSVFSGSRFAGHFLGGGHTIDNLSLDDATPYIYKNANVGGLFGMLSGEVRDLTFTNLHADSTTIVAGAVCALMNGATIENCIVKGHIETSRSSNNYAISGTAGLAGASLTTRGQDFNFFICRDTIRNCVNYADIITHVGRGANIASHSVGGIIGHGGVVIDCANAGDISGGSECGYIGGIGGDMTSALRCFNTGRVTIAEAPQAIDYFVGGVVGKNGCDSTIMYCYNAGTVDGSDRSPVGGIVGYGAPRYCYMTNTVTGRGKYLGSIAGTENAYTLHCYYDKQMSPLGGENGQDAPGRSLGLETTGMLGSALQSSLGDTANWIFTPGLYPQLAISADVETQHAASLRAQLSRVSVMPVVLGSGQNWMSAHDSIPLRGCDEHHFWTKLQGCVTVDSCHVTATDRDMGVIELAATIDSVPYRFVTLKFNMDEKHALVIKNAAQFDTMRMVINEGGYYNYSDSTFHTAIPANADSTDFVAIDDGGNERFFKLITDIDINDIKEEGHVRGWIPVGGFADDCCALYKGNPFKGTFDGCGHTIRHLTFQRYDNFHPTDFCDHHQGLFGTVDGGTVKNLRIAQSDTTLGNSSAFLCSVNKGGTLYHCEIDSCTLTIKYGEAFERHDHALLCAKNEGGTIDSCQVKNSEIAPDSSSLASISNIGGVCALNDRGVVSRCIAEHLSINDPRQGQGALQSVGGICGKNFHGQLQFGTIRNSQITLKMNLPHKFIGGICGLSGYDPDKDTDEQSYAHIPSVISDCNSDSTIINAYTHGDNDSTKKIMNIGGIVGSCQGRIIQLDRCSTMENSRILAVADTVGGICGRFCGEGGESLCNACGNNASVTGNDYVGGIVGLMSGAQLCVGRNQGEVRSLIDFEYNSGYYAGGIAGAVVGESSLFDCDNSGTVAADSSYVGGIAGALMGESNLFLCINHGDVSGFNQVGGLAGLILKDAWFEESSNNGLVRGIAQVGGLVGYLKSSTGNRCSDCHNYADTIHFSAMGGGVCGYAEDTTMLEGCSSVMILPYDTIIRIQNLEELRLIRDNVNNGSNSYEGIVIVLDWDLNLYNGWIPIGTPEHPFRGTFDGQDHTINFGIYNESTDYQGFFGYMQGTVKNVNFTQCSVIGRNYVGVIAGYCNGTISNCYSYREKVEGEKYVGGLVGMASYSEIQDCFNGNNIVGEQYVSGIVGDFASCKNDNCYDTMKYDLYGGNVSRCYNYGMVRATGDTSHVGGIAGYTSSEVKHCYNSGIVDGKDFVGGLCGQLDGDNLHHCYNAGHVSATGNNKGAVCGSLNLQNLIYNCFYDRQMCTVQDNNASGYNTLKMTGTALQNVFGTDYWSYHDNEYPTLKTTKKDSTYFRISVKPLLLPGNMPVDKVVQPFCGVTGNAPYSHVEWSRYGTATKTVDTIHLADKDSITLLGCGVDTLKVSHPGYGFERLVPIVVAAKEATVETVHTCGNSYKWNKNNKYYYETGFYTCDTCANKQALDLTITPVTITSTLINSTCKTIPDGAVLASVTGGPGNGFRYLWTNSLTGDTISNTPALTNITAGYYSVTVTDSLFPTCEQTSPQQLSSSNTVELTIKSCDASKTYDGTALTGNRYVVTEEGFEPDTLLADSFAILANGDTLRVTFDSNAVNAGTYENKFTYSISNGIDHSCHYDVDTIFGTLSITPRLATITVNDTSKTYGDEDPVFSGTVKGLVNSDSLVIHYFRSSNIETVGNHPDILTAELNENYTVTIDSGDLTISCRDLLNKIDTANWPDDIENWNECYSPSNTNALPSIDSIKKLIIKQLILANNDTLQPDAFQVLAKDSTILANDCDWKWVRTYTVKISNPNFCDSTSRVIYVSGGDQSAPVRSINDLWKYGTLYQDACLASFDIDHFFPQDTDLFYDCSQMTITHKDTNTGDDHYGWTIRRSYVVTDACGHTIYDTIEVSGRDQTPPVASNPEVKNNTLWADSAQCLCDSIRTIHDIEELTTIFGISDACSGEDVRLVSSSKTLKTGEHCDYTVIIAYVVADAYGNSTTIYHAQFIQDTIGPTFDIVPHDTTLCVDPDGNYENTVTRVADEITVTNLHDNCTKLQESFSVQSSIDTSRFNIQHPRGYRITQGESDNGVRHYKQLWTVTDSCGNTTYDSISIHVRPLPKITRITNREQSIIYGDAITNVWIYHQYSDLSITGLSGIGLDSLGCSVEHKKDQNNNEYDRVYGDPEFAVNATFLVTANSHQGWGCSSVDSTFSINVERRPIVITATDATKKYDGTPLTSNNYTCTTANDKPALVHEDVISRLSFSGSQTNVGSCTNYIDNARITAPNDTTIDKTSSYWIDYHDGTLTVTVNDTLIKVIPGSASKVYDGLPLTKNEHDDFTVTGVPEGLTWTATADGTVTNVVPGVGEKAVNAVTSFHIFDANNNDVTAYFTNIDTDSTGTLTITPVSVLVNADAKSKVYGEADPPLTVTITGVLENDDFIPNYTISRETGDTVGQYIITPTGAIAQGNYAVTYDTALFTILCRNIVEPANWPANLPNQNTCFGNADTIGLKDASEIQTLFANCNPVTNASEITVTEQDNATATSDCEWTWIRIYDISITGGCASTTKTMSVSGGDSTAPALTGTWPNDIENVNSCFDDTLQNLLYTNTQVKALFSECGNFTVDSTLNISGNNCLWTITKTYTVKDACGNIYHTLDNTLPSMSVSGGDHTAPALTGTWPNDIENVNSCFNDTLQNLLYTNAQVKALFSECGNFTVDSSLTTTGNHCEWTVTKTYTVTDACGNIYHTADEALPTMSVSGGDRTAPMLTGSWPDNITEQNNCLANADNSVLKDEAYIQGLFEDCSGIVTVTFDDDTTGNDCGWTITRTYTVVDGCQNTLTPAPTMSVSGSDQTAPVLTGNWPDNITGQNNCLQSADKSGLKDESYIETLYEDCSGIVTVTFDDDTTGNDCEWTITRTYTVMDGCGNALATAPTMSVSGGNHRKPSFTVPAAATICPNTDGSYNIDPTVTGNVSNVSEDCHSEAQLSIDYSDSEPELLTNGQLRIIRTWTVTDACGNDSVQTQVIFINPLPEISVTPELQTIVLEDPITPVTVTNQYSELTSPALTINNVATSFANAGLQLQWTSQGLLQVSGTPADTGTYKLLFTAISDQFPVCYPKQAEATVIVRLMQDTVKVISGSASKAYDGTPLTNHNYVVTLGNDTIPADEGSNGLIFSVHFHDKLVITPNPESTLTNAGDIANEFTCVLDNPEHYKGLKKEFGTLTVNKATLSMSLDTARAYNGHPFVVTADQLHITGLAETDTITGTITTESHVVGTYTCTEGSFNAFIENGIAVKSGFAINHGLGNYTPDFDVTLNIDNIDENFECPADLHLVLKEGNADTMLVFTDSATLDPMVDNIVISSNLNSLNPITAGTHTLVWTLADDLGNVMTSCEQTVTVEYSPCEGVTYHGHFYDAKRIGYQCWMTENLCNETDAEGHPIANRHAYKEIPENLDKFGYLYSWYSAMNVPEGDDTAIPADSIGDNGRPYVQGICPDGWAVGDHQDFSVLFDTVNNTTLLKDAGDGYWLPGFGGTLPNSGFNARANGLFNSTSQRFEDLLTGAHFWIPESTTSTGTVNSAVLQYYCNDGLFQQYSKGDLKGVRCIRKVAP